MATAMGSVTATQAATTDSVRAREQLTKHGVMARTPIAAGALLGLLALHSITLAATYAGVEPHPPTDVTPFIGATVASGLFALPLVRDGSRMGFGAAILFGVLSIVGFGPHKLFTDDAGTIFPAVIAGFALSCTLAAVSVLALLKRL